MELQLGLALPAQNPSEEFNLSNYGLPSFCVESHKHVKNKRSFEESLGLSSKNLPLLVWNGQPNEEDDRGGKKNRNTYPENENNEEENLLVGWPPIKSWRKKKIHQQHQRVPIRNDRVLGENGNRGSNSLFVKVKMEGVAIGRKINLRPYSSYETLTNTLMSMFDKYQKPKEDKASYTLKYQDKEGDWLVAGDVPWQSFIDSVKRLEIVRSGVEEATLGSK
ncbi:auxin-responsive protein IAA31 [Prosopis cineraria]|uniref:auxin-responsive protein IAA31 n=1 Tax=Prosopis cineraria TaxID=364024 RepID=UPI00240F28F0|nr:auxin-responsive protein IAA31 [Prosopis cineraria]XP_054799337.1 auxin-responsive protein IAA31 [Prosopis cineraria]